ncbi:MAG TPA: 50S ribosomal protein L9 [Caldisericia bacterium]|nr:50S ribosomal protein L9 [Caldisericia bacterium]HOL83149.1 50S ribosomal protein L9 [Caldisericia bacterium]HON83430.1 50S ribosomal protein L9 [Caldisericia bacterium]HPC56845.1 50S ribosomal protein L9 [Caldisericia bacterium]HPP43517.1 50S ribosomal protein L9 [Caldisericia bacterium]
MKKIKVILLKDITNLGKKGDIVDVSFGFYMNYLEKNNLAKRVSEGEERDYELRKKIKEDKESKEEERAKFLKDKIEKEVFTIKRKAGEKGKLYGSVTNEDIAEILKKKIGVSIDKKKIEIEAPIKTIGYYEAKIKLFKNLYAKIKLNILEE